MNRRLNFRQTEKSKVYFSSDFHLNHNPKWPIPIWKMRGYNSVNEMNDSIIDSINKDIKTDDILWFLGDFCLNTTESQFEEFLSRIFCQNIYCLFGNHNSCVSDAYKKKVKSLITSDVSDENTSHQLFIDDVEIYPIRHRNLIYCGNYAEITVDGRYFILQHFPMHSWNYMKNGAIHLYGHQHCKNNPVNGKRMDVGWDRDKRPYSANEIIRNMENIQIISDGGHH